MEYLAHYGIKGQKWGVRRYQNADGTLTSAGRKRYGPSSSDVKIARKERKRTRNEAAVSYNKAYDYSSNNAISLRIKKNDAKRKQNEALWNDYANKQKIADEANANYKKQVKDYHNSDEYKEKRAKAIKVGAAVAGTAAVVYLASNPITREAAKKIVASSSKKLVSGLKNSVVRAGKAMVDGAMISIGGLAVDKLARELKKAEDGSDLTRARNKVIVDATRAGVNAAVRRNGSNSSNGGQVSKEVSDALGPPSKNSVNKNSSTYQGFFKDPSGNLRDDNVRSAIKGLVNAGYDADQINDYLRRIDDGSLKHYLLGDERMDYLIHMADGEILEHHGIRGMKWGVRRYQNADGSLTNAGKKRYKTINDAADHAKNFVDQAKKDAEKFKEQRDSGKGYATKDDYDRWIKVTEKQIREFGELEKKFRSVSVNDLNKENVKEAQDFLKRIYYNADYTDGYYKGEWRNYQLNDNYDCARGTFKR